MKTDKMEAAAHVARLLQEGREAAGKTKYQAAKDAGMSEGRWRQLEKGTERKNGIDHPASTSAKTLVKMARAIGIDPQSLLDAAGINGDLNDIEVEEFDSSITGKLSPVSLDVSDLTPEQLARVEGFILGLRQTRN